MRASLIALAALLVGASGADAARHKLAYLPTARHSSETGYGVGVKFKAYSFETTSGVTTRILAGTMVTEEGQYTARLDTNAIDESSGVELRLVFEIRTLPERFYGIGADTPSEAQEIYDPTRQRFHTTLFKYLKPQLKLGVRYEFEDIEVDGIDPDGQLIDSDLLGVGGASVSGLGLVLAWDTRNDNDDPTAGSYHQLYALRFDHELNSSHDFDALIADLRWFTALGDKTTLASQVFSYHVSRDVPFTRLASLGGRAPTRGYRRGRFLDDTLLAVQGEIRWDRFTRAELVGFAGVAEVFHGVKNFRGASLQPTIGVGIRAQPRFAPARGRFDIALGTEGVRLYVGFGEAF
jgi:outer membrane protein assembly factor BamA